MGVTANRIRILGTVRKSDVRTSVEGLTVKIPLLAIEFDISDRGGIEKKIRRKIELEDTRDPVAFDVEIDKGSIYVSSNDISGFIALALRRIRVNTGMTLSQAIQRLGKKSKNTWTQCETGKHSPSIERFVELVTAVDSEKELVLSWRDKRTKE